MTTSSALAWLLSYSSCKKLGQFLVSNQQNYLDLDVSKNRSGNPDSMFIIVIIAIKIIIILLYNIMLYNIIFYFAAVTVWYDYISV